VSGVNGLALTKLDVLDGFDEIQICTHYKLGDKVISHVPAGMTDQANVQPSDKQKASAVS
jgi:adenylosuccinate synthase